MHSVRHLSTQTGRHHAAMVLRCSIFAALSAALLLAATLPAACATPPLDDCSAPGGTARACVYCNCSREAAPLAIAGHAGDPVLCTARVSSGTYLVYAQALTLLRNDRSTLELSLASIETAFFGGVFGLLTRLTPACAPNGDAHAKFAVSSTLSGLDWIFFDLDAAGAIDFSSAFGVSFPEIFTVPPGVLVFDDLLVMACLPSDNSFAIGTSVDTGSGFGFVFGLKYDPAHSIFNVNFVPLDYSQVFYGGGSGYDTRGRYASVLQCDPFNQIYTVLLDGPSAHFGPIVAQFSAPNANAFFPGLAGPVVESEAFALQAACTNPRDGSLLFVTRYPFMHVAVSYLAQEFFVVGEVQWRIPSIVALNPASTAVSCTFDASARFAHVVFAQLDTGELDIVTLTMPTDRGNGQSISMLDVRAQCSSGVPSVARSAGVRRGPQFSLDDYVRNVTRSKLEAASPEAGERAKTDVARVANATESNRTQSASAPFSQLVFRERAQEHVTREVRKVARAPPSSPFLVLGRPVLLPGSGNARTVLASSAPGSPANAALVATDVGVQDAYCGPRRSIAQGSWTPVTVAPFTLTDGPLTGSPGGVSAPILLTDGSVLVHNAALSGQDPFPTGAATREMWRLVPDAFGRYESGTWVHAGTLPPSYAPAWYASAVLPDGRVVLQGGEVTYNASFGAMSYTWTGDGAIYDPVANTWSALAPPPFFLTTYLLNVQFGGAQPLHTIVGDAQSVVLANGTLMLACALSQQAAYLDAATLTWRPAGEFHLHTNKLDANDEEGWTLLPNGRVLAIDCESVFGPDGFQLVEEFDPATNQWSITTALEELLVDPSTAEIGPATLRPDGTIFALGANGNSAIYDTASATWRLGPDLPMGAHGEGQLSTADVPAVLLPNGNVLFAARIHRAISSGPLSILEFDGERVFYQADVAPGARDTTLNYLLLLPTGQVLFANDTRHASIYTSANTSFAEVWRPTIACVPSQLRPGTTYSLSGVRLNGMSQACGVGDDYQAATNFPLVRLTNQASGHVKYARTHDHSSMAVASPLTVYTLFDVPASAELGATWLEVVANGIPSLRQSVTLSASAPLAGSQCARPAPTPAPTPPPMPPPAPDSWRWLDTDPPFLSSGTPFDGAANPILLTDGRVMFGSRSLPIGQIWALTPSTVDGSYQRGTWQQLASLPSGYSPWACGSAVLPDGRVVIVGGEYNVDQYGRFVFEWQDTCVIYDPVADAWRTFAPPAFFRGNSVGCSVDTPCRIGDAQVTVLANGTLMIATALGDQYALLDAASLTWSEAGLDAFGRQTKDSYNNEESLTLLPSGEVLSVACHDGGEDIVVRHNNSEVYDPISNRWRSAGSTPDLLCSTEFSRYGGEIGGAVLRSDGKFLQLGDSGKCNVYDTATRQWSRAASVTRPSDQWFTAEFTVGDNPVVLLPHGSVLAQLNLMTGRTTREFDGAAWTDRTSDPYSTLTLGDVGAHMLPLPTGEILWSHGNTNNVLLYTPRDSTFNVAWRPLVQCVPSKLRPGATYALKGLRLNGMSQAVGSNDDEQGATNYPLVRLTHVASGHVRYARTHDHTSMAVASHDSSYTYFDVPAAMELGACRLEVVTNGIASLASSVAVAANAPLAGAQCSPPQTRPPSRAPQTPRPTPPPFDDCSVPGGSASDCELCSCDISSTPLSFGAPWDAQTTVCSAQLSGAMLLVYANGLVLKRANGGQTTLALSALGASLHAPLARLTSACARVDGSHVLLSAAFAPGNVHEWLFAIVDTSSPSSLRITKSIATRFSALFAAAPSGTYEFDDLTAMAYNAHDNSFAFGTTPSARSQFAYLIGLVPDAPWHTFHDVQSLKMDFGAMTPPVDVLALNGVVADSRGASVQSVVYAPASNTYTVTWNAPVYFGNSSPQIQLAADPAQQFGVARLFLHGAFAATRHLNFVQTQVSCASPSAQVFVYGDVDTSGLPAARIITIESKDERASISPYGTWAIPSFAAVDRFSVMTACTFDDAGRFLHTAWLVNGSMQLVTVPVSHSPLTTQATILGILTPCGTATTSEHIAPAERSVPRDASANATQHGIARDVLSALHERGAWAQTPRNFHSAVKRAAPLSPNPLAGVGRIAWMRDATSGEQFVVVTTPPASPQGPAIVFDVDTAQRGACSLDPCDDDASAQPCRVYPLLVCACRANETTMFARFGYENTCSNVTTLQAGTYRNYVAQPPPDQAQPSSFARGLNTTAFTLTWRCVRGSPRAWVLRSGVREFSAYADCVLQPCTSACTGGAPAPS